MTLRVCEFYFIHFVFLIVLQLCVVMPRGTELSDFEKGQIQALQGTGLSNRVIAKRLGRSHTIVDNFIKKGDGYGKKKRSGRRPKLSDRDKRSILRIASNSTTGARRIRDGCAQKVSKNTVWRVIKSSPHLTRQKLKVNPKLKPEHEMKRMNFAKEHVTWTHNWDTVNLYIIFSSIFFHIDHLE
jgi:transposase